MPRTRSWRGGLEAQPRVGVHEDHREELEDVRAVPDLGDGFDDAPHPGGEQLEQVADILRSLVEVVSRRLEIAREIVRLSGGMEHPIEQVVVRSRSLEGAEVLPVEHPERSRVTFGQRRVEERVGRVVGRGDLSHSSFSLEAGDPILYLADRGYHGRHVPPRHTAGFAR